jgi:hypothetical protein
MIEKDLRLPRRLSKYKRRIFKKIWEENKKDLTMSDVAFIVRHELSQFYKIITDKK